MCFGSGGRRDLNLLTVGQALSVVGDDAALIALVLRVQAAGGGRWQVAAVFLAGTAPLAVAALPAGWLADRCDSRALLTAGGLAQAACSALLATHAGLLATTGLLAGLSALEAVTAATRRALLPRIIGEPDLTAGVSRYRAALAAASVGAPALGGLLTAAAGPAAVLLGDTATFLITALVGALLHTRRGTTHTATATATGGGSGAGGFTAGLRHLTHDRLLTALTINLTLFILLAGAANVDEVFLIRDTLHGSPLWYGASAAAWAAGITAGSLLTRHTRQHPNGPRTVIAGAAVLAAALLGFAAAPNLLVLLTAATLGGTGNGILNVTVYTLLIRRTPEQLRGRAGAALSAASNTASITSLALGGLLATLLRPRLVFGLAGSLALLTLTATGPALLRAPTPPPTTPPTSASHPPAPHPEADPARGRPAARDTVRSPHSAKAMSPRRPPYPGPHVR